MYVCMYESIYLLCVADLAARNTVREARLEQSTLAAVPASRESLSSTPDENASTIVSVSRQNT